MQTQKNYKNAGMHIQVPNNSAEPLNAVSSGNTELSSSCNLDGCSTELEQVAINRIPVISKSGNPLMPCKPAKARKLLEQGKATRIGGFMDKRMSLHNYDLNNKRFTQNTAPNKCYRLFNQRIMFEVEHDNRSVKPVYINTRGTIPPCPEELGILYPLIPTL